MDISRNPSPFTENCVNLVMIEFASTSSTCPARNRYSVVRHPHMFDHGIILGTLAVLMCRSGSVEDENGSFRTTVEHVACSGKNVYFVPS